MALYDRISIRSTTINRKKYYVNVVYPEVPPTADDTYIITSYEDRPDLLAYDYYGDER